MSEPLSYEHTLRNSTFHHGSTKCSGVEVHKALMHDSCAFGEVRAQTNAIGVSDTNAAGHDVIDHAWELVDAEDLKLLSAAARPDADVRERLYGNRTERRPSDVGEESEDACEVDRARFHQSMAEQVQAEVDVGGIDRISVEIGDDRCDNGNPHIAQVVSSCCVLQIGNVGWRG